MEGQILAPGPLLLSGRLAQSAKVPGGGIVGGVGQVVGPLHSGPAVGASPIDGKLAGGLSGVPKSSNTNAVEIPRLSWPGFPVCEA